MTRVAARSASTVPQAREPRSRSRGAEVADHPAALPPAAPLPATPTRYAATSAGLAAVRRLVRALRLSARRVEATTGLSAAQLFVLRQIEAAPGASLTELAARTLADRTSVRFLVDRLVAEGLVVRGRDVEDRRRASVQLTVAGAALLRAAPPAPTTELLTGFERLSEADLEMLAAALTRLTEAMGVHDAPAEMLFAGGADDDGPVLGGMRSTHRERHLEGHPGMLPATHELHDTSTIY